MSQSSPTVWQARWQALEEALLALEKRAKGNYPTVQSLAACLRAFGASQFSFFHGGFANGRLLPSVAYPPPFTLRATLNQVAYDLTVLQQALDQRVNGSAAMQETLKTADQLAQHALNPAIASKILPASTVLTYFHKSAKVRVVPYAPVVIIGIPGSATHTRRDYLAIPHEVGHFVFWQGPKLQESLKAQAPVQPGWCSRWLEEIFADVYACLVAGPVMGIDFQDLLLDNNLDAFLQDDGEHPVDAIRPSLHNDIIAVSGFGQAATALRTRWQAAMQGRGHPHAFTTGDGTAVTLEEGTTHLQNHGANVHHYLTEIRSFAPDTPWTGDIDQGNDLETLYAQFETWLQQSDAIPVPTLLTQEDKVGLRQKDGELLNPRRVGATKTWIDSVKQEGKRPLPPEIWLPILLVGGWNTSGPEQGWPPTGGG